MQGIPRCPDTLSLNIAVDQFKKMVEDNDYSRYTLTALAELCGFSSRASFFRSFKKSTGVTPNEYIRSIGGTAKDE
jgi:AraC-like DNA-binding protein